MVKEFGDTKVECEVIEDYFKNEEVLNFKKVRFEDATGNGRTLLLLSTRGLGETSRKKLLTLSHHFTWANTAKDKGDFADPSEFDAMDRTLKGCYAGRGPNRRLWI